MRRCAFESGNLLKVLLITQWEELSIWRSMCFVTKSHEDELFLIASWSLVSYGHCFCLCSIFYWQKEYSIARQNILLPNRIFYCPTKYYIAQQNILIASWSLVSCGHCFCVCSIFYCKTEYSIAQQNILLPDRIFYCL